MFYPYLISFLLLGFWVRNGFSGISRVLGDLGMQFGVRVSRGLRFRVYGFEKFGEYWCFGFGGIEGSRVRPRWVWDFVGFDLGCGSLRLGKGIRAMVI